MYTVLLLDDMLNEMKKGVLVLNEESYGCYSIYQMVISMNVYIVLLHEEMSNEMKEENLSSTKSRTDVPRHTKW